MGARRRRHSATACPHPCPPPAGRGERIQRRQHHLRRERRRAEAHAGRIEDRIRDRRRARHRRRLARAQRRLARARHVHHLDHRHFAEVDDRVAAPFAARDQPTRRVRAGALRRELHLLLERAAGGLDHVAVDLVLDAGRVDHQPGVMPDDHAAHMHLAGLAVDLDVGHPRRPGGAEARPLAVHVARIGEALAEQDVAARAQAAIGVLLRPGAHAPAGLLRGGAHQLGGARVVQMAQAELRPGRRPRRSPARRCRTRARTNSAAPTRRAATRRARSAPCR